MTAAKYLPVYRCTLVREDKIEGRPMVHGPANIAAVFREMCEGTLQERFLVAMLDTKNKVIGISVVTIGLMDQSLIHPRECFRPAILANAASIIIGHNHPSGDPTPSEEDRRVTARIEQAGQILGIELLDHIIIGDGTENFVSLKEMGWV